MDFDLIFDEFPTRIIPYDYDTYFASQSVSWWWRVIAGRERRIISRKAWSGTFAEYLSGLLQSAFCLSGLLRGRGTHAGRGICDAIPIRKAIADGFDRNVVILTRNKGYRKDEKEKSLLGSCIVNIRHYGAEDKE